MAEAPVEINMMPLADMGQPGRIALEIHRQLRLQFGSVPARVPLADIAKAVGIVAVQEFDVDGFLGTLVIKGNVGAVGIRSGMRSGRRNFTLGHEIGHWLIPTHRLKRQTFECTKSDMNRKRGGNFDSAPPLERIEIEANEFSATLLIPGPEYNAERKRLGKSSDVRHIRELSNLFDVSQEVMSGVYVRMEDTKLTVVHSHNGRISRIIPCTNFPYMGLRGGVPVPTGSYTHSFIRSAEPGAITDMIEMPTEAWLENAQGVSSLYEQVVVQEQGWATTLLSVDEAEIDYEDDDRNWNRRNSRF